MNGSEVRFSKHALAGILKEVIDNSSLPVVVNINVGHATPRCIIPFGVPAKVDVKKQEITFKY